MTTLNKTNAISISFALCLFSSGCSNEGSQTDHRTMAKSQVETQHTDTSTEESSPEFLANSNNPTGMSVTVGGVKCVVSVFNLPNKCAAIAGSTLSSVFTGIVKDCDKAAVATVITAVGGKKEKIAEELRTKCINDAVATSLNAAYMHQFGVCLPIVNSVQQCVGTFVDGLGLGFNKVWCDLYPADCGDLVTARNKAYIQCSESASKLNKKNDADDRKAHCYGCCMGKLGSPRDCNDKLEFTQGRRMCEANQAVCNKCSNSF